MRGMKCFTDITGACFDVQGADVGKVEDIF